ncbi:hypothetical protein LCFBJUUZ_CDS0051 [Staphylococcus phage PG-2021_76]
MEKISPIIVTGEKVEYTKDVRKISEYVMLEHDKIKGTVEDAEDRNALNPFLYSLDKKFVAQYNPEVDGVGFYKVEESNDFVTFRHATREEIEDSEFPIIEPDIKNVLTDVLPQGDVLIHNKNGSVNSIYGESVLDYAKRRDINFIQTIYYTGISTGQSEIQGIHVSDLIEVYNSTN